MLRRYFQRGDTIIEVLLAITVFSLLAVIVITVMNQATNVAQRALEITLVRQQIDSQAEALRAAHQAYTRMQRQAEREDSVWNQLTDMDKVTITTDSGCPEGAALNASFVMDPANATLSEDVKPITEAGGPLYAHVAKEGAGVTGYGMWLELTEQTASRPSVPNAYSFRIRACWYGPGTTVPNELETIVRLYDVDI